MGCVFSYVLMPFHFLNVLIRFHVLLRRVKPLGYLISFIQCKFPNVSNVLQIVETKDFYYNLSNVLKVCSIIAVFEYM
jgi:hypothetical protein